MASEAQPPQPPKSGGAREYGSSILIAVGLALFIRSTVVQAFYIPSQSMEDTLLVGDYLLANKFVYGAPFELPGMDEPLFRLPSLRDPQPGDIVIFRSLTEPGRDLIKRCIAVGGQTILIRDKQLFVDGEAVAMPPEGKFMEGGLLPRSVSARDNMGPYRVPDSHFFMMGDNRDNSNDSRVFGPVPKKQIKGKAMIIYWSSKLVSGPLMYGLPQLLLDAGNFIWNLPTLPFRSRYTRLGTIIH
jgi:signal peptidase I